ncbi:MAG: hypothetical protein RIR34_522 [Actinomycetota bacterium]|jgi:hypothetical protein
MRYALFALGAIVIFTVFVTVFAASADRTKVRQLPKWVWVLLCVLTTPVGGILYLSLGRPLASAETSGSSGSRGKSSTAPRTVAPDDDPEFLRNLEKRLREEGKDNG